MFGGVGEAKTDGRGLGGVGKAGVDGGKGGELVGER